MPDLGAYFRTAAVSEFSGTVYRICPSRYVTLYTSLSKETARREMARYFTIAPRDGLWRPDQQKTIAPGRDGRGTVDRNALFNHS
jgi:hypothetical protein